MFKYQPFDLTDFTGGMADEFVNAPANRGQYVTNFFTNRNKTLQIRFGCILDYVSSTESQIPVGTQRINTLINYRNSENLLVHSGKRIYYRNPSSYATLSSTVTSDLFYTADVNTHIAYTPWNGHVIVTPENFDKPIKIYKDGSGNLQARTAGLPALPSSPAVVSLGPVVQTISAIDDTIDCVITSSPHGLPLGTPVTFADNPYLPAPLIAGVTYYAVPTTSVNFKLATSLANAQASITINILAYAASGAGITYSLGDQNSSYVYAFFYSYEYTVADETFLDEGPVTLVQISDIFPVDNYNINISSIPPLLNSSGDMYDTANVKIQVYRSIDGGQEFYKLTELSNGTTSYSDSLSDTLLQDNQSIYTSGGVPNNDPPPLAKYCHSVNGVTYYAHIKADGEVLPSVIRQSQALDPDSVPGSYFDELEDEITGISSVQDIPIVGCRKHIYKIEGTFDEVGRGGMFHRRISDFAGCISHESFVQAEGSLFWFGEDGIYTTEGYKCIKLTNHLNARYKQFKDTLVDKTRKIKGAFNPETRLISWTISTTAKSSGSEECDALWILDLNWGLSEETACYLWNGSYSFNPSSVVFYNNKLYRADKMGYVLSFDSGESSDDKIVAGTDPAGWFKETIIYNFRSISSDFGTSFTRKIANKLLVNMRGVTTQSVQLTAINDEGRLQRPFTPIRWRKGFVWGDEDFVWGDPNFEWYYGGIITVDRRFPAKGLRFDFLQVDITNAYTNIVNSDVIGTADVDSVTKSITLSGITKWPTQAVDYYIYLEQDNYVKGYKITARTDSTLVVQDILNTLTTSTQKWQIKGYKKDEVMNLVGLSISWAATSRSFDTFNTGEEGGLG